jgi:hypothetical protein
MWTARSCCFNGVDSPVIVLGWLKKKGCGTSPATAATRLSVNCAYETCARRFLQTRTPPPMSNAGPLLTT